MTDLFAYLGFYTDACAKNSGNQTRPEGPRQEGDLYIYQTTFPAPGTRKNFCIVKVNLGDIGTDVEDYVAALPRPVEWDEWNEQAKQEWVADQSQVRSTYLLSQWMAAHNMHPGECGCAAPRLRLDIEKYKALRPDHATNIDKGFDPDFAASDGEMPIVELAELLSCCEPVHAQFRADKAIEVANTMIAGAVAEAERERQKLAARRDANLALAERLPDGPFKNALLTAHSSDSVGHDVLASQKAAHESAKSEYENYATKVLQHEADQQALYRDGK